MATPGISIVSLLSVGALMAPAIATGAPRRAGHSLGADTAMGRLGARPLALLDSGVPGPHGQGPYDHSHHHRAVLRQPGGPTRERARHRPPRLGHVYPTFWQCPQSQW